jgi:hypothetical protein
LQLIELTLDFTRLTTGASVLSSNCSAASCSLRRRAKYCDLTMPLAAMLARPSSFAISPASRSRCCCLP